MYNGAAGKHLISVVDTEDMEAGICGPSTTSGTRASSTGTQLSTTPLSTMQSMSTAAADADTTPTLPDTTSQP